jgi:hypothetical protein
MKKEAFTTDLDPDPNKRLALFHAEFCAPGGIPA